MKCLFTWTERRLLRLFRKLSTRQNLHLKAEMFSFHSKYFVYRELKRVPQKLSFCFNVRILVPSGYRATYSRRSKSNVRKSNSIERHRTPHFQWVRFPNKSNSIEQIELNPSDCVRLSSETELNRTQLNGFRSIGSGEPKQARRSKFFLRFFYYLFNNTNPIYKLSTAIKRTEQNKPWKLRHPCKAAFLVAFDYTFEAYDPQRIWSHFCGISSFTKNTCATLRVEVTRASKIW